MVVIEFDKNELITAIEEYALKDGKIIEYKSENCAGGHEATLLQDLLDQWQIYKQEAIAALFFKSPIN